MEKAGQRIPGSKYMRAFCLCCGEPIRSCHSVGVCSSCREDGPSDATLRAAEKCVPPTDDGDNGHWHNAVRCWEESES